MTDLSTLKYSEEHEWVREGDGRVVRIGVTDFATDALGDIVYVSLPTVGSDVVAGDACGELESTKSVSDVTLKASLLKMSSMKPPPQREMMPAAASCVRAAAFLMSSSSVAP